MREKLEAQRAQRVGGRPARRARQGGGRVCCGCHPQVGAGNRRRVEAWRGEPGRAAPPRSHEAARLGPGVAGAARAPRSRRPRGRSRSRASTPSRTRLLVGSRAKGPRRAPSRRPTSPSGRRTRRPRNASCTPAASRGGFAWAASARDNSDGLGRTPNYPTHRHELCRTQESRCGGRRMDVPVPEPRDRPRDPARQWEGDAGRTAREGEKAQPAVQIKAPRT